MRDIAVWNILGGAGHVLPITRFGISRPCRSKLHRWVVCAGKCGPSNAPIAHYLCPPTSGARRRGSRVALLSVLLRPPFFADALTELVRLQSSYSRQEDCFGFCQAAVYLCLATDLLGAISLPSFVRFVGTSLSKWFHSFELVAPRGLPARQARHCWL